MKLILDRMLGNLATWLRIFGHDTEYAELEDQELISRAKLQSRILITKDAQLASRARSHGVQALLLKACDTESQLLELGCMLGLKFQPKMDRCSICNGQLSKLRDLKLLEDPKYSYVPRRPGLDLWICSSCGQIYWQGSHWKWIQQMCSKLSSSPSKL